MSINPNAIQDYCNHCDSYFLKQTAMFKEEGIKLSHTDLRDFNGLYKVATYECSLSGNIKCKMFIQSDVGIHAIQIMRKDKKMLSPEEVIQIIKKLTSEEKDKQC